MFASIKFIVSIKEEAKKLNVRGEIPANNTEFTLDERLTLLDEINAEFNQNETIEDAKYAPSITNLQLYSDLIHETFAEVKKTIVSKASNMGEEEKKESLRVLNALEVHRTQIGHGLNKEASRLKSANLFEGMAFKTKQLATELSLLMSSLKSTTGKGPTSIWSSLDKPPLPQKNQIPTRVYRW